MCSYIFLIRVHIHNINISTKGIFVNLLIFYENLKSHMAFWNFTIFFIFYILPSHVPSRRMNYFDQGDLGEKATKATYMAFWPSWNNYKILTY